MKIATIINYCTNDYRFINANIHQAKLFSSQIIIPISSHFYNGQLENYELLKKTYDENTTVDFINYTWDSSKSSRYWHNYSRALGYQHINKDIDWILYLDADEIVEYNEFNKFIASDYIKNYDSFDLLCYWYFRDAKYRATSFESAGTLVRRELGAINPNSNSERGQLLKGRFWQHASINNTPIIHHYSWVRTKEEMLNKVKSWGHNQDNINWVSLVEQEFTHPFNGTDFVHNYGYDTVENKFNI